MTRIAERVSAPLRVGLAGRPGVGRRTVARALRGAGITVTADHDATGTSRIEAEVICQVLAETVKPEDVAAVAAAAVASRPVLVVLNKSDVRGGADAAAVSARIGAPVLPMAALFAVAAADARIDIGVRAVLRALSGVDAVAGRLAAAGAGVRYRRVLDAVAALQAASVGDGPAAQRVADFLSADATVAARMAAATDVLAAARIDCGPPDDPGDRLPQAVRWWRCRTAPLSPAYRGCAADIARGALRLWSVAAP